MAARALARFRIGWCRGPGDGGFPWAHRLAPGVDLSVIAPAEAAAGSVPGVLHAHARARWTGRTLRVEIEGWVDPGLRSATPTRSAGKSPRRWPGNCRKQAA